MWVIHKRRPHRKGEGAGVCQMRTRLLIFACICKRPKYADRGERGQKWSNFADVHKGWPRGLLMSPAMFSEKLGL